jgi:hypothetical protein
MWRVCVSGSEQTHPIVIEKAAKTEVLVMTIAKKSIVSFRRSNH